MSSASDRRDERVDERARELVPVLADRVGVGAERPGERVALLDAPCLQRLGHQEDHGDDEEHAEPEQAGHEQQVRRAAGRRSSPEAGGGCCGSVPRSNAATALMVAVSTVSTPASASCVGVSPNAWSGLQDERARWCLGRGPGSSPGSARRPPAPDPTASARGTAC